MGILCIGILVLQWARLSVGYCNTTKVQHVSFEYFTSRGCSTDRDEEVNWATTIPNLLPWSLLA